MEIDIQIDETAREPRVVIYTEKMTPEVRMLAERIEVGEAEYLTGFEGSTARIMDPGDIIRIATEGGEVRAWTENGAYKLRMRLYQAEARLSPGTFVRISQSEIINIRKVRRFDLSDAGVIRVLFENGTSSFVSRRYLPKIRALLGIQGGKDK